MSYNYQNSNGIIVADTGTTLAEVQAEYQSLFGADIDLTPATPQGILITAETLTRDGVARLMADLANQFNPNIAGGIFLDAMCALSGLARIAATHTTVTATVTGTDGTIIYAGAQAETTAGDVFECTTTTTIPISGTTTAPFRAVLTGAVPCPAGTLTAIADGILGWDTITNSVDGVLGTAEQSDLSLSALRRNTLASQGTQTTDAVTSGLYATAGVQSLQFRENFTSAPIVVGTKTLKAHSIYVCVNGGTDADVAQAIINNRSAGCDFNGTTSVNVTASSGQVIAVLFDRPAVIQVLSKITVRLSAGATGNVQDTIKQRIVDYANGLIDGEAGFVVGGSVSPFELAGAAMGIAGVYVLTSEIAPVSTGVWQSTEIAIAIDKIAAISLSGVTVVVA